MTSRLSDGIAATLLLMLCAAGYYFSLDMRPQAATFPRMILAALALLSLMYLIRTLLRGDTTPREIFLSKPKFFLTLIISIIYIGAFSYIGYFTSTLIFIPLISYILGFNRHKYIFASTAIFMLTIYVMFSYIFDRALPRELLLTAFG